jgi:antitoxin VapB
MTTSIDTAPSAARHIRLFRNGANQALRIPREFEFATQNATIRKVGAGLLIEPAEKTYPKGSIDGLLAGLAKLAAMPKIADEEFDIFEHIDDGLLPLDDINL